MKLPAEELAPEVRMLLALQEAYKIGAEEAGCSCVWLRRSLKGFSNQQIFRLAGELQRKRLLKSKVRTLRYADSTTRRTYYILTAQGLSLAQEFSAQS